MVILSCIKFEQKNQLCGTSNGGDKVFWNHLDLNDNGKLDSKIL